MICKININKKTIVLRTSLRFSFVWLTLPNAKSRHFEVDENETSFFIHNTLFLLKVPNWKENKVVC